MFYSLLPFRYLCHLWLCNVFINHACWVVLALRIFFSLRGQQSLKCKQKVVVLCLFDPWYGIIKNLKLVFVAFLLDTQHWNVK